MLKGATVLFSHQKTNQAGVALAHLLRGLVEGDSRPIDHREIGSERSVEGDEAVIQDRDDILG